MSPQVRKVIHIDPVLHRRLRLRAVEEGVTAGQLADYILIQGLRGEGRKLLLPGEGAQEPTRGPQAPA